MKKLNFLQQHCKGHVMAEFNNEYALSWHDHAANFPNSFSDLLEKNELVDVTLVADGYLLNAHRLVLSALSPYFRQMFQQMSANQQAFVFLKDVSRQTLQDLTTFIYRGEVTVEPADLEQFYITAKALKINGFIDEGYAQPSHVQAPKSTASFSSAPQNGPQYQSSQTVKVNSDATLSNCRYQKSTDSKFGQTNETGENSYRIDTNYSVDNQDYGMDDDNSMMDQKYVAHSDQRNAECHTSVAVEEPKQAIAPKAKCVKRAIYTTGYNMIADIRKNLNGKENLFHNGYKFSKGHTGTTKQGWQCSKVAKCRAYVSTIDRDGITMMKVSNAEHCHEP